MTNQYPFEKLGLLYLGRELNIESREASQLPLLYKSKNLTTHAAIIGMTGSGKTGLGIGIIEEAIMDRIPSIIIDPKGDMGNLLLTFPELRPEDFRPWIDPAEAARKDLSPDAYASKTAEDWQRGLAAWGQDGQRIRAMAKQTDRMIYTPGSSAGISVSVLGSFTAPAPDVLRDTDTLNSLVNATTTSLLSLVGVGGDPLQSKEHILLSAILLYFWRKGEDLTMERLIANIVSPPFDKVGVFGLDVFYAQPDRMTLAMRINNILASPTFAAWTEGEPLDIQRILYTAEGKPRTAIFSISHLSESERMFFVAMLLTRFVDWMRKQPGTSSLKALLYMDEIFGYFPPTSNPPSKKPMLLLLKQARAYGIGVVLATQNPVDLDYKGLSNIGSWFVGRLQTSQDQDRVVEGIAGASNGRLDTGRVRSLLSGMKGRQFVLNCAHLDAPLLFATRWVLSFLKGPISASDIKILMATRKPAEASSGVPEPDATVQPLKIPGPSDQQPVLPRAVGQYFYLQNTTDAQIVFEPWLAAVSKVRFYNASRNIDAVKEVACRLYLDEQFSRPVWENAEKLAYTTDECTDTAPSKSSYYPLPAAITGQKNLKPLEKSFSDYLYQTKRLELFRVKPLKLESTPGESLGDFKVRISDYLREKKDTAVEKLRRKYETRQKRIEQRLNTAMDRLDKERMDVQTKTTDTVLSFGVAVVGALFGNKTLSTTNASKVAAGMRKAGRVAKEKADVRRAQENVAERQRELEALAVEIEERIDELSATFSADAYDVETFSIKPRRRDIFDVQAFLLWVAAPQGKTMMPSPQRRLGANTHRR